MRATPRALCCFDFRRKERRGEEVPNSSAKSPSQLNTSPSESSHARGFPPESTPTSRSENAAWTLQRNRALTAGSPLEQPASKQSLSPSSPPAPEGRGTPLHPTLGRQERPSESERSRLPIGQINSPRHGRLFSRGRVHAAHARGREEADKESQGSRVCLQGEVWGDGSNLALEQHTHRPFHSAPPGH